MKPLIGIIGRVEYPGETGKIAVNEAIRRSVVSHGGNPICILCPQNIEYTKTRYNELPKLTEEEKEMLKRQLDLCDGIIFPGGFKTLKAERFIMDYLLEKDKPILGICLGMQILGSYGCDGLQNEENNTFINHKQPDEEYVHSVTIDKSSRLYKIIGIEKIMVNSRHSFHIIPNDNYKISSLSSDNIIESIEFENKKYVIGVQWHPENLDDEISNRLFNSFINACK